MDRAVAGAYTRPRLRRGALSASIRGPEWRYHAHGAAMRRAAAQQLLLRRRGNGASDTAALPRDLRRRPGHGHSRSFPDPDCRLDTVARWIVPLPFRPPPLKQRAQRTEF